MRFTFVCDRYNRTSTAALLAALETLSGSASCNGIGARMPDDDAANHLFSARVVTPREARHASFELTSGMAEVLCMSAMTMTARRAEELHSDLRGKWGGDAFTSICGGPHPTGDPASVLGAGFDYACVGEGEAIIRDVTIAMTGGEFPAGAPAEPPAPDHCEPPAPDHREPPGPDHCEPPGPSPGESPLQVPGLFYLKGGSLAGTVRSDPVDLEACPPLPLRKRFPTHIEIGRGCRWGCAYCQTPGIHGRRERFRSLDMIERVVDSYARTGMKDFRFVLPNALGYGSDRPGEPNCRALGELLERVRSKALGGRIFLGSFPSEARPEYVTAEALGLLREYVSNERLVIGGQSGSQRMLNRLRRGHSVDDIRAACDTAIAAGFRPAVDLVLGFPGETADDRRLTLGLIEELAGKGSRVNMHFFMPLPGTPLSKGTPVFLRDDERRVLDRLAQRGIVRGGWRRQEEFSRLWVKQRPDRNHSP